MAFNKPIIRGGNTFRYWSITSILFDEASQRIRIEFGGFSSREAKQGNPRDYIPGHAVSRKFDDVSNWNLNPKKIGYELAKQSRKDENGKEKEFWADSEDILEQDQ